MQWNLKEISCLQSLTRLLYNTIIKLLYTIKGGFTVRSTLATFNQLNLLYQEQKKHWALRLDLKLAQVNILMAIEPDQERISHA